MTKHKFTRFIGLVLYFIGAILGFFILTMSVWGDIEANTFDRAVLTQEKLNSLNCPVFITSGETGVISATIDNPSDRDGNPNVRTRITQGFVTLYSEYREFVPVPAHSSTRLEWNVTEENAAFNRLILARVYQFKNFEIPARSNSCGIVLLPISGITGVQVFYGGLAVSAVLMFVGLWLYRPTTEDLRERASIAFIRKERVFRAFIYMGALFIVAAMLSLIGDWLLSVSLMLLAVISVIAVLSFAASS
ncbi:MAG: hypothetical protein P8046_10005 [Anaerolineales bacterium]|jgi:hypothetical protein